METKTLKLSDVILKFEDHVCDSGIEDFAEKIGDELPLTASGMKKLEQAFDLDTVVGVTTGIMHDLDEDKYRELLTYMKIPFCDKCYEWESDEIAMDLTTAISNLGEKKRHQAMLEIFNMILAA